MTQPGYWPVNRFRQYGAGLWLVAGALAVWGSFAPLLRQYYNGSETFVLALWAAEQAGPSTNQQYFGIPVALSVVLLVVAAGLSMLSTRQHPAAAQVLAARLVGTGGTGLLIGSAGVMFAVTANILTSYEEVFTRADGPTAELQYGVWVLAGGCLAGIAGTVLMLIPKINRDEPETPPMGIPVIRVLEPEYDEPVPEDAPKQA